MKIAKYGSDPRHGRVAAVLDEHARGATVSDDGLTVEAVIAADAWARERAAQIVG